MFWWSKYNVNTVVQTRHGVPTAHVLAGQCRDQCLMLPPLLILTLCRRFAVLFNSQAIPCLMSIQNLSLRCPSVRLCVCPCVVPYSYPQNDTTCISDQEETFKIQDQVLLVWSPHHQNIASSHCQINAGPIHFISFHCTVDGNYQHLVFKVHLLGGSTPWSISFHFLCPWFEIV